jgi:hypothetical protein
MPLPSARRCAGLSLLAAPLGALAIAASPAAAATSGDVNNVCPWGSNDHRVISRSGPDSSCREGVPVMKAWVKAHKPKQFRNYRCGEVKGTHIGFTEGFRWFATWQCRRSGGATYTIWTRY